MKSKITPIHTKKHQDARLAFASEHLNDPFGSETVLWIDIDEKSFYAYKKNYVVYVPKELEHTVKTFHEVG